MGRKRKLIDREDQIPMAHGVAITISMRPLFERIVDLVALRLEIGLLELGSGHVTDKNFLSYSHLGDCGVVASDVSHYSIHFSGKDLTTNVKAQNWRPMQARSICVMISCNEDYGYSRFRCRRFDHAHVLDLQFVGSVRT